MEDNERIITVDLELEILHSLYRLAIEKAATLDEVVEEIIKEYLEKNK